MTWADLIAAVRAQIDVSDDQAYAWLLERARVLNGEAGWLTTEESTISAGGDVYGLPIDFMKMEAVKVDGYPYRRSTPSAMDIAQEAASTRRLYAEIFAPASGAPDGRSLRIWPPVTVGQEVYWRYLADVPDERSGSPPFPSDIQSILADGAIAIGLARMDERFDSAGYFDAKFADGIVRLRRRRGSQVGRGGTPIRLVT